MNSQNNSIVSFTNAYYEKNNIIHYKLSEILNKIKSDINLKKTVDLIRNAENKQQRNDLKKKLPVVIFQGKFNHMSRKGFQEPSGLAVIDIDIYNGIEETLEIKNKVIKDKHVVFAFLSPSGGLKVGCRIPKVNNDNEYKEYYLSLIDYYFNFSVETDTKTKDISRLCFLSYDENVYINYNAEEYNKRKEIKKIIPVIDYSDIKTDIKDIENALEYIKPDDRDVWVNVCCALKSHKEDLFYLFDKWSSKSIKYKNTSDCRKTWDSFKDFDKGITLGTLFYYAKENGYNPIDISFNEIKRYKFLYLPSNKQNERYAILDTKNIPGKVEDKVYYKTERLMISGFIDILLDKHNINLINLFALELYNDKNKKKTGFELKSSVILILESLFFNSIESYKKQETTLKNKYGFSSRITIDKQEYNPSEEEIIFTNEFEQVCLNSFKAGKLFYHKKDLKEDKIKADELFKDPNKFKNIKIHIMNLCGEDIKSFYYLSNSLSHSLKFTADKRAQSFSFVAYADGNGLDGAGKGKFFSSILNPIFGSNNNSIITEDRLGQNFNNIFFNKLFVALDEAEITSPKIISKFKAYSGAYNSIREDKGINAYNDNLFFKSFLFSNSPSPVSIKESDRRWSFFRPSKKLKDTDFDFKLMWGNQGYNKLTNHNENELKEFVEFLRFLPVDFDLIENPLDNELRNNAIETSRNAFQHFIYDIKSINNIDDFLENIGIDFNNRSDYISSGLDINRTEYITTNNIYQLFLDWCKIKGLNYPIKSGKFNDYLKNTFNINKLNKRIEGKSCSTRVYLIKDIFKNSKGSQKNIISEDI